MDNKANELYWTKCGTTLDDCYGGKKYSMLQSAMGGDGNHWNHYYDEGVSLHDSGWGILMQIIAEAHYIDVKDPKELKTWKLTSQT